MLWHTSFYCKKSAIIIISTLLNQHFITEIDEVVSKVKSSDDYELYDYMPGDTLNLSCSAFTGNETREINWCYGTDKVDENPDNIDIQIEKESKNVTQMRKCTFFLQSEIQVKVTHPGSNDKLWFGCTMVQCQDIEESKKYFIHSFGGMVNNKHILLE